jgi:hypothetical protein
MSADKKEKIQVGHNMTMLFVVCVILFGTVDIRRCVDSIRELPAAIEMMKRISETQEAHSVELKEIREVLKRNKLAGGGGADHAAKL